MNRKFSYPRKCRFYYAFFERPKIAIKSRKSLFSSLPSLPHSHFLIPVDWTSREMIKRGRNFPSQKKVFHPGSTFCSVIRSLCVTWKSKWYSWDRAKHPALRVWFEIRNCIVASTIRRSTHGYTNRQSWLSHDLIKRKLWDLFRNVGAYRQYRLKNVRMRWKMIENETKFAKAAGFLRRSLLLYPLIGLCSNRLAALTTSWLFSKPCPTHLARHSGRR